MLARFRGLIRARCRGGPQIVHTRTPGLPALQNLGGLVFVQLGLLVSELTPALDDRGGL